MAEAVEQGFGPAAQSITTAINHRIDEILRLVFALGIQRSEKHLPTRADKGIFADAAHDHHRRQHSKARRQRQSDETQADQHRYRGEQHSDP